MPSLVGSEMCIRDRAGGGSMSPAAKLTKIDKALKAKADQSAYLTDDEKTEIRICAGTACHASGRVALRKAVEKTLAERGLTDKVAVVETGCHGFCEDCLLYTSPSPRD